MTAPFHRLAVLGDPVAHSRSPELHRAGLAALGLEGASHAVPTTDADLAARLSELSARGYHGVNLTRPLKSSALGVLQRVSEAARLAVSVNTVGLGPDGWWGDTTDGPGFLDLLIVLGRRIERERVLLLGAGGAARSLALAAAKAGAREIVVSARDPRSVSAEWRERPATRLVLWRSAEERAALRRATVIVNATPIGGSDQPVSLSLVIKGALIVDLSYGPDPGGWVSVARAEGREAYDGLGLLVFQARRSLALWFSRPVPVEPLTRAVGWPR